MRKIAVTSCKGGSGKTTLSCHIAGALSERFPVGLADMDVTGANSHLLMKVKREYDVIGDRIEPAVAEIGGKDLRFISLALASDSFVRWKDGMCGDFVKQIIGRTNWGDCEYLVIDSPPGNHSDSQAIVSLSDVVVVVSLPGRLAELDTKRTLDMIAQTGVPIAGAYINFAGFKCPNCGREERLFGEEPDLEKVPVIEHIPYTNSPIRLDAEKLIHHLENPVKLEPRKVSPIKRKLVELLLRTVGA